MGEYIFGEHALHSIRKRGLTIEQVMYVIEHPECTEPGYEGRTLHERELKFPDGRSHRVFVVVDYHQEVPAVVTVLLDDRS